MMGFEMHLVFPCLVIVSSVILSVMEVGQWVGERLDPSWRDRGTWIHQACDYVMSAAYAGALLSIPSVYFDALKAGTSESNTSNAAQTIQYLLAVSLSVAAWRVSVRPAVRLWRETKMLPMTKRGLWTLKAFSCPLLVPDAFDTWRKSGECLSRELDNR